MITWNTLMLLVAGAIIALPIGHTQAMQNNEEELRNYCDAETQHNALTNEQLDVLIQSIGQILHRNTHQDTEPNTIDIRNSESATIMQSFINLCNIQGIIDDDAHQNMLYCLESAMHEAATCPVRVTVKQLGTQDLLRTFARIPLEITITNNQNHTIEIYENTVKRPYSPINFILPVVLTCTSALLFGLNATQQFFPNEIQHVLQIITVIGIIFCLTEFPSLIKKYYPSTNKIALRPHESKSIIVYLNPRDIEQIPNEIIRSPAFEHFTKELFH